MKKNHTALYVVDSISSGLFHFGNSNKMPMCGAKLFNPSLTDREVRYNEGELEEHWISKLQGNKWVRVAEYNYCKRCLSKLIVK